MGGLSLHTFPCEKSKRGGRRIWPQRVLPGSSIGLYSYIASLKVWQYVPLIKHATVHKIKINFKKFNMKPSPIIQTENSHSSFSEDFLHRRQDLSLEKLWRQTASFALLGILRAIQSCCHELGVQNRNPGSSCMGTRVCRCQQSTSCLHIYCFAQYICSTEATSLKKSRRQTHQALSLLQFRLSAHSYQLWQNLGSCRGISQEHSLCSVNCLTHPL